MATVKKIKKYQSGGSSEKGWKSVDLIKKASKADSVAKKPYYKLDKPEARLPKQKGGGVTKKAQDGVRADSYAKGTYTGKYETPGGTRYYQGSSPDISTAMKIAANKARSNSADSLSSSMVKKKTGGKVMKKAKSGGSFPDLNKDGKVTKADVLVGRGVIKAKGGMKMKKQAAIAIAMKKAGKSPMMKKGGIMKKK
jgi:hypothetical protein